MFVGCFIDIETHRPHGPIAHDHVHGAGMGASENLPIRITFAIPRCTRSSGRHTHRIAATLPIPIKTAVSGIVIGAFHAVLVIIGVEIFFTQEIRVGGAVGNAGQQQHAEGKNRAVAIHIRGNRKARRVEERGVSATSEPGKYD